MKNEFKIGKYIPSCSNKFKAVKNTVLILILCFCFSIPSFSIGETGYADEINNSQQPQTKTISGKVVGEDGISLPGVSVVEKGTTRGTITDIDGLYKITVSSSDVVLQFSFVGKETVEMKVSNRSSIDVVIKDTKIGLNEVVVVGYGQQKKADLTSSIATLSPKEVLKMPGNVTSGLQGAVAGVNVSAGKVRIRGVGTIGNTDPLWVVDGLIDGMVPNENEIESIQVLKDASSCAIFGSRGANGVIIVTTKKGIEGAPQIEYNAYGGTKYPWRTIPMMNAVDFGEYVNEAYYNYNQQYPGNIQATPPAYDDPYHPLAETDWQDAWFQRGGYQNHNLSISGGGKNSSFRAGFNYSKDKGVVIRNVGDNMGLFFNSQFKKGRFTIGESFTIGKNTSTYGGGGYFDLLRTPSCLPIYDATQEYGYYITGTAETGNDMINQIAMKNLNDEFREYTNIKGTVFGEVEILKNLKYKINIGIDFYRGYSYTYAHVYDIGKGQNPLADLNESTERQNRYVIEHTLSYELKLNEAHTISALYGITSEQSKYRQIGAKGEGFISPNIRVLSNATDNIVVSGKENEFVQYSHLARVNYSYMGKYLATFNFRMDATSRFPSYNRYGYFPSLSVGWRASEEAFIKDNLTFISNLKFRGSYGTIGNQRVGDDYGYESFVVSSNQYYTLGSNQGNVVAPIPKKFSNPELKWETSYQTDLGIDVGLFSEKLNFTIDYYDKRTTDLLVEIKLPPSAGSQQASSMNAGEILNRGLEFAIVNRNKIGDFSYNVGFNFTLNHNEVLSLGTNNDPINAGEVGAGVKATRTAVGNSIGTFYTYKTDGLFQSQDEVNQYTYTNSETGETTLIQPYAQAGDIKFKDIDKDGTISENDRDFAGSPIPVVSYGLTADCEWKGFDFSVMFQGDYGNKIFNNGISLVAHGTSAVNQAATINDRFRAEDVTITTATGVQISLPKNTDTTVPRAVMNDPNGNFSKKSNYYVEDGSYLRLKRVTIGYTFPKHLIDNVKIESLRVYIGSKNLLTITNYSFFDPEVVGLDEGGGKNVTRGIDMQQSWASLNPTSREFFVGVQLKF